MVNALADFGDQDGWSFYAGGGIGYASVEALDESEGALAWQLIAGARTAVSENVDLGLKYRYFRTGDLDFANDIEGDPFTAAVISPRTACWRPDLQLRRTGSGAAAASAAAPAASAASAAAAGDADLPGRLGGAGDGTLPAPPPRRRRASAADVADTKGTSKRVATASQRLPRNYLGHLPAMLEGLPELELASCAPRYGTRIGVLLRFRQFANN